MARQASRRSTDTASLVAQGVQSTQHTRSERTAVMVGDMGILF